MDGFRAKIPRNESVSVAKAQNCIKICPKSMDNPPNSTPQTFVWLSSSFLGRTFTVRVTLINRGSPSEVSAAVFSRIALCVTPASARNQADKLGPAARLRSETADSIFAVNYCPITGRAGCRIISLFVLYSTAYFTAQFGQPRRTRWNERSIRLRPAIYHSGHRSEFTGSIQLS